MVLGIDHGYGFVKTQHAVFAAGAAQLATQPPITDNILFFNGSYYQVGVAPEGIAADKTANEEHYILTLAAIAEELKYRKLSSACVQIAAGIPLTRYGAEKDSLTAYLTRYSEVSINYEGKEYRIYIDPTVYIYPQGFAAIAPKLNDIIGPFTLVDIGTGTTEILPVSSDHRIDLKRARSLQWGISDCIARINEEISRSFSTELGSDQIIDVMLDKGAYLPGKIQAVITEQIKEFAAETLRKLVQNKVNYQITPTYFMGGGGNLLQKYGVFDTEDPLHFITDISANAKGYEVLAEASEKIKERG